MSYFPQRGDVVWLDFTPQSGHEQAGKRPAIVLSPYKFNKITGFILCCPITSRVKGYPFEVKIEGRVSGVILSDQVRSLDFRARNATFIEKVSDEVVEQVVANIEAILRG